MGSLTVGIRTFTVAPRIFTVIFLLRRLVFAIALASLADRPAVFICVLINLNLFFMIYLGSVSPHNDSVQHRIEIFNEMTLQLCIIHWMYALKGIPMSQEQIELGISETQETLNYESKVGWSLIYSLLVL